MKSTILAILCCLMAVSAFASGQQDSSEAGPVTLEVWDFKYGEDLTGPVMKKVDAAFEAANPGVKVDHQPQPMDNYYAMLKAAAAANEGPDVALSHSGSSHWLLAEVMIKLDDYIKPWRSEISEASWRSSSKDADLANGVTMIPITMQGFGLYYNKELFAKAGLDPENPPTTGEEFLAACAALKKAGIIPLLEQRKGYPKSLMYMTRLMIANDIPLDGTIKMGKDLQYDGPEYRRIFNFFEELRKNEYFDPDAGSLGYWGDVLPKFGNGDGAIIYGLLSDIAHWKMFSDSLGKDKVGFIPTINLEGQRHKNKLPLTPAGIGYCAFQWSKNKEAAVNYAMFYGKKDGATIFMNGLGALSPNLNLDLSGFDYPILEDVLNSIKNDAVTTTIIKVPVAEKAQEQEQSMMWMLGEITMEEYISKIQTILENELANE